MLKIGSKIKVKDNTGALYLRILNLRKKKNCQSYSIKISDIIFGVVILHDIYRRKLRLKRKDFTTSIISCVRKKYSKKNNIFIRFSQNRCIPLKITRFIVPIGTRIYTPIFFEVKYLKGFKVVRKSSSGVF